LCGNLVGNEAGNARLFESTGVGTFLLTDFKYSLHTLFEPELDVAAFALD
jgi:spore maturation protein CgeB